MTQEKRKNQAKWIRISRKIHRVSGISLFVFFFLIGITGLLLGWKKNSGGYLLAKTAQGQQRGLSNWLPLDSLQKIAIAVLKESVSADLSTEIDRMDIRPDKGIVKVLFVDHYQAIQLDGHTGEQLNLETRRADFLEHLHDGTIIDRSFGISSGSFKLVYTSVMGLALILFTITGFWLWYGPRRLRKTAR